MYQEAEQGIWKPVLGALGAASVILTIVGNLVFSPKPSLLPTLKMADSEGPDVDRSNSHRSSSVMIVPAVRSREIDRSPSLDVPSKRAIVERPIVAAPVESQNSPCDTASDILVADQAQPREQEPYDEADAAGRLVDLPNSATASEKEVLVTQQAPVAESAAPSEQALQAGPSIASQPIVIAPVDHPNLPNENANDGSVAACDSEPQASQIVENSESRVPPVAVDNSAAVVVQKLSHYERKMRRKMAHLEKKRNRLLKDDCCLVCR